MIDNLQEYSQTLPDTDIIGSQFVEENDTFNNNCSWGTLIPANNEENSCIIVLTEDCYSFGRSLTCDVTLTSDRITSKVLPKISKIHFKIIKGPNEEGTHIVFVEDLSSNGTFVNGVKVGKSKKVILTSGDDISLAMPSSKAYTYIDTSRNIDQWLTSELSSNFHVLKHLGAGGFGDVKLVINKNSFEKYAMKKVEKDKEREKAVLNEVNILKRLKHPCIVNFEAIYETPKAVYITLEYMSSGNLLQRVNTRFRLSESESKMIFYQLILGVKYLHEEGIVHRDLKPENVLLEAQGRGPDAIVKITDFGLSKILHSATNLKTACGTLNYVAPEIMIARNQCYSNKVDIWSLGVILFFCLSGKLPFNECKTANELLRAILSGAYTMPFNRWHLITPNAIWLVKKMLKVNPDERISANEVILHNWFQDPLLKSRMQELIGDKYLVFPEIDNQSDIERDNVPVKKIRIE